MYRAVAWKALQDRVDLSDEAALARLAAQASLDVGDGRIRIDDRDVAAAIRTPEMDMAAAVVARQPRVREALIARQRALGAGGGIVMEGRDIGTVVFPAADVKIFLDASPEERARRRASDPTHTAGRGSRRAPGSRDRARGTRPQRSHAHRVAAQAGRRCCRDRHDRAVDRGRGREGDGDCRGEDEVADS